MIPKDAIEILKDIQQKDLDEADFLGKCAIDMAITALKEQRPHGKWIIVDDCEKFIARCSVCGRILDSRFVKDYPFCRCGADMREGEPNVIRAEGNAHD